MARAVGGLGRGEVAVDVRTPGADAAQRAAPVTVSAGAVVEIGEHGERGGIVAAGVERNELGEFGDQPVEAREDVAVKVTGAAATVVAADEVEEDVFAEVEEARVVELEAAVFLVVGAVGGGDGGDIGHDRTVPRALPTIAEGGEERHGGLP